MNLKIDHNRFKETTLYHRYITNNHIEDLLKNLSLKFEVSVLGKSVNKQPIYGVEIGKGKKKILLWSQMHGNESTTTKALFDFFKYLNSDKGHKILTECTLFVIPILNPDGAKAYTRVNANKIDLNRDALNLSQPESNILKDCFNVFKPDFCFNLHGQRTIFSAGMSNNSATVSFLAPAQDANCTITPTRKVAMGIIASMNDMLQAYIPNQIGIYDDAFNINCVGDTFQTHNVPTVLFEAGHYQNDYSREEVRQYIFMSLINGIEFITNKADLGKNYESYCLIPENKKLFYDILIKNALFDNNGNKSVIDLAIQYEEVLENSGINFKPRIKNFGNLSAYFGHKSIDAQEQITKLPDNVNLELEREIDFVKINDKLFSLNLTNN